MALTTRLPYRDLVTVAIALSITVKTFQISMLKQKYGQKRVQTG